MDAEREGDLDQVLGSSTLKKIHSSRVLMVGAGGIGCELLKNLVLSGFKTIEVVSLESTDRKGGSGCN